MQLFKVRIGGDSPLERLAVRAVGHDEVIDILHEMFDAGERTSADRRVGDHHKPSFDLIEPRAVGR